MRKITEIIVHCTATPEGRAVTAADVDRWHRQRGFDGIGYHYLVYLDGTVAEGRPIERIGAHCKGHNANSIGVCYVGGLATDRKTPKDTRTSGQKDALLQLINRLRTEYPGVKVRGHRDYARKDCPCFDATGEYAES